MRLSEMTAADLLAVDNLVVFDNKMDWLSASGWYVCQVNGRIQGDVKGGISGNVGDHIGGSVHGCVAGDVKGTVYGTVKGDVGGVGGDVTGSVGGNIDGTVHGMIGRGGPNFWKEFQRCVDTLAVLNRERHTAYDSTGQLYEEVEGK